MLRDLHIRNIAVIDELSLEFAPGLNLLTGETGAGKSIIIDSLGLTLGRRSSSELLRSGAKSASVQAVFSGWRTPALEALLDELGIEAEEELILRRQITASGTSRAFVNDVQVNLNTMAEIGAVLVTIHGQGEGDELLTADGQLDLLDAYAGTGSRAAAIAELWDELKSAREELESISSDERARERELDLLIHQTGEIEKARLDPAEEEELRRESQVLRNAEQIRHLGEGAYFTLYESEEGITTALAEVEKLIAELAEYDDRFQASLRDVEGARYTLQDVASTLRDFTDRIEADPRRLEQVEQRLDVYRTMQRKYGSTTEDVLAYLREATEKRESLARADERLEELRQRVGKLEQAYDEAAADLSRARQEAVKPLSREVEAHLAELAMDKAVFNVGVEPHSRGRTRSGTDRVTFLIAANPGETPKTLSRVASGGEQSRVMLAVKSSIIAPAGHRTVIFDEVDSGIGGRVAEFVGRKLSRLAAGQQVICITHLPQIAVYAGRHDSVRKTVADGRTHVSVVPLGEKERIDELARMLGGEEITAVTRDHAGELLRQARAFADRS